MEKLKINYHLTQICNFGCKFCFAKYEKEHLDFEGQKKVIKNIAESGLFDSINFAGGEPLLIKELPSLIEYAAKLGLKVSLITNGYLLTDELLKVIIPNLVMIGISVHSFNETTKLKIGSCTKDGRTLSNERLDKICFSINKMNEDGLSNCKIKINTVCCEPNISENLNTGIENLKNVQRWKILRCQEFGTNQSMLVSNEEFNFFKKINSNSKLNQVFENDMKDTYIMVNPAGILIKESSDGLSYKNIGSVLDEPLQVLMNKYELKLDIYKERYLNGF